jgi:hypothetical protein
MMISGGDYSPNSHTFFKHPFKNNKDMMTITGGNSIGALSCGATSQTK